MAQIRSTEGYITFFTAIILSAVIALTGVLQRSADARALQLEAGHAAAKQLEITLSLYDRDLWDRYGLHGLAEESVSVEVLHEMLPAITRSELSAEGVSSVWDPVILETGIGSFMKTRLTAAYFSVLYTRLKTMLNLGEPQKTGAASRMSNAATGMDVSELQRLIDAYYTHREDILGASRLDGEETEETDSLTEIALAGADVAELDDFLNGNPGGLNLDTSKLQEAVDGLSGILVYLQAPAGGVYSYLSLREYPLGMLSHAVSRQEEASSLAPNRGFNLRGYEMAADTDLKPLQAEEIITGSESRSSAEAGLKRRLTALRILFNLLGISMNEGRMQRYYNQAAIISGIILVLSLGNLSVPPEAIQGGLILAAAWRLSRQDRDKLLRGSAVPLLPFQDRQTEFPTVYEDYLRLLLLTLDTGTLLARTSKILRRNMGGKDYYAGIKINIDSSEGLSKQISYTQRYMAYESAE